MNMSSGDAGSKSERSRKRIFDAAVEVFRRDGFADARLADIAKRAELQTASLYYHFDSKEALAEAVVAQGIQRILDRVRRSVDALPEADAAGRLTAAITAHLEAAFEAEDHGAPTVRMFGQIPSAVRHRLGAQNRVVTDYWEGLVSQAQQTSVIRTELHPRTLSLLVLGSLNWATEWYHQEAVPLADIVQHVMALLLDRPSDLQINNASELAPTRTSGRPPVDGKPRRARSDVSKSRMVTAARACFAESGVAATRMDHVAQRAGLSRPHLYAFVSSRAELVQLVAVERLHELGTTLQQRAREMDGDIAEAIVGQVIDTIVLGGDDPEFSLLADAMPRSALNTLLTSGTSPVHTITAKIFGPLLARAIAEGRLRSDVSIDAIVDWLQGVIALLSGRNDLTHDELRSMARRFVVRSLLDS
jgi:TetR/AcrR family transcriptional regulator, cholesterol catabolism regulator